MSDFTLGLDAKLYYNSATWATPTWNELDNVKNLNFRDEDVKTDVTTRGSGGRRENAQSITDWMLEFQMVWDTTDAGLIVLRDAKLAKTGVEVVALDGDILTVGSQGPRFMAGVFQFERTEDLEGVIMVNVRLEPIRNTDKPEWFEVT